MFSDNDPYVEIQYKNKVLKTKTIWEGGRNPKWNKSFKLDVVDPEEKIAFRVFDEDAGP